MKEGNIQLQGSGGSQLLSGLLMSLPMCDKNSTIEVKEPTSTPYVDLTIQTLKDFGVTVTNHDFYEFKIPENKDTRQGHFTQSRETGAELQCFLLPAQ